VAWPWIRSRFSHAKKTRGADDEDETDPLLTARLVFYRPTGVGRRGWKKKSRMAAPRPFPHLKASPATPSVSAQSHRLWKLMASLAIGGQRRAFISVDWRLNAI
jgi:hypothetical protein